MATASIPIPIRLPITGTPTIRTTSSNTMTTAMMPRVARVEAMDTTMSRASAVILLRQSTGG